MHRANIGGADSSEQEGKNSLGQGDYYINCPITDHDLAPFSQIVDFAYARTSNCVCTHSRQFLMRTNSISACKSCRMPSWCGRHGVFCEVKRLEGQGVEAVVCVWCAAPYQHSILRDLPTMTCACVPRPARRYAVVVTDLEAGGCRLYYAPGVGKVTAPFAAGHILHDLARIIYTTQPRMQLPSLGRVI